MRCCCGTKSAKSAWMTTILSGTMMSVVAFGAIATKKKDPPALKDPPSSTKPTTPATTPPTTPPTTPDSPNRKAAPAAKEATSVYDFTVKRIDGTDESLGVYKGKVLLIVNVASQCGFTPQYEGLQKLYTDKKDAGLVVLGFPANDFKQQEPGTNEEIQRFCSGRFGVTFPMFEKVSVAGSDAHPLYKFLAKQPEPIGIEPKWNFTKFLVDREGRVVANFDSRVKPDDPELMKKVNELLAARPRAEKKDELKKGG